MVSFCKLWEIMNDKDSEHIDTGAMKAIRSGLGVDDMFWDNFIQVCNNAEKVADLLGVRVEQVLSWPSRIKHNLDKVQKADANGEGEEKPKNKIIDTGDSPQVGGTNQIGVL